MNLKTLLIVATILLPTTVFAKDLEIPIPCAPTAIVPPPSLTRVQGDGDIWNFKLVAAPNSNVTFSKQDWSFNTQNPVAEPNNPDNPAGPGLIANWGRFGGGDGTNSLSWDAPNESGTFTVSVHAKRHCEGGGGGGAGGAAVDEDFDASWTTTVVKIDHIEVDSGGTALPDGPNTPDKTDICAAVKAPGGYVILKAVLTPQIAEADLPINAIIWTGGGQAVPNSKLKWRVPKTVAKKYSITATVGNTSYTMLSFVVWAEATEGWFSTTQFPNYKSPNNNQIPTYPDGLGGPEPDGSFASWCEMRFTIAPHDLIQDGIDGIVMKDSFDWDVERLKKLNIGAKVSPTIYGHTLKINLILGN